MAINEDHGRQAAESDSFIDSTVRTSVRSYWEEEWNQYLLNEPGIRGVMIPSGFNTLTWPTMTDKHSRNVLSSLEREGIRKRSDASKAGDD